MEHAIPLINVTGENVLSAEHLAVLYPLGSEQHCQVVLLRGGNLALPITASDILSMSTPGDFFTLHWYVPL